MSRVPNNPPEFGELLRHARHAAGMTQEELAEKAGLSTRGISDLERGARRTPQRQTLDLLADALTDVEIAEQLFVSPRTVSSHLTSIYNKLGVSSRAAATRIAVEEGML